MRVPFEVLQCSPHTDIDISHYFPDLASGEEMSHDDIWPRPYVY